MTVQRSITYGSRPRHPKGLAAALAMAVALLPPAAASAWAQAADFETNIHGHEFSRVTLEGDSCELKVRVWFSAPQSGYDNPSPARNVYRFHARVKLDDGRELRTRVFSNSAPGARAYTYVVSSETEDCWAKQERKIKAIDVEGCRGSGCRPEAFK